MITHSLGLDYYGLSDEGFMGLINDLSPTCFIRLCGSWADGAGRGWQSTELNMWIEM